VCLRRLEARRRAARGADRSSPARPEERPTGGSTQIGAAVQLHDGRRLPLHHPEGRGDVADSDDAAEDGSRRVRGVAQDNVNAVNAARGRTSDRNAQNGYGLSEIFSRPLPVSMRMAHRLS
jgi:hypothetical protein